LGLFDSFLSKEKKVLAKASKNLEKADALERSGSKQEAASLLEQTGTMLKENMM
jgi:hypothetical protein